MKYLNNPNLCEQCIRTAGSMVVPTFDVADTGRCGSCGAIGEVFDLELLSVYLSLGLTPEHVYHHLPRLRGTHLAAESPAPLSWPDVASKLAPLVTVTPYQDTN